MDSYDFVYVEDLNVFMGITIRYRMTEQSKIMLFESQNGDEYDVVDDTKTNIKDFAHNIGISKTKEGHINSNEKIMIGYAFGSNWGRWSTIFQNIRLSYAEE